MIAFANGAAQFFAPTHLLAVIALGLLLGQQAIRLPVIPIAALAAGLAVGSLIVASAVRDNPAALALLVFAIVAAGLTVVARPLPSWVVAVVALPIGAALPLNAPPQEFTVHAAIVAQLGFALAAILALALATLAAAQARVPWQRIGVRIVASWIAASAILVLALRLAR
jgi:urease accessory protein